MGMLLATDFATFSPCFLHCLMLCWFCMFIVMYLTYFYFLKYIESFRTLPNGHSFYFYLGSQIYILSSVLKQMSTFKSLLKTWLDFHLKLARRGGAQQNNCHECAIDSSPISWSYKLFYLLDFRIKPKECTKSCHLTRRSLVKVFGTGWHQADTIIKELRAKKEIVHSNISAYCKYVKNTSNSINILQAV